MISDHDRSFYFGASDASSVVANRKTKTFKKWWMVKLGVDKTSVSTKPMKVGNAYEHKIMEWLGLSESEMDPQIIIPPLNLRVNYDGIKDGHIYEIKTHAKDGFKVSPQYQKQCQAEMFAYFKANKVIPELTLVAYQVDDNDYANYFNEIDPARIERFDIDYDEKFCSLLEKNLAELRECVIKGVMPH